MREVEWTPAAVDSRNGIMTYLTAVGGLTFDEALAVSDQIEDFSYTLANYPALTSLQVIATSADGSVTYREVKVKKSERYKLLYRLREGSSIIEIIYVRSTSQNIDPKVIAAEYEAGLL